jgi:hypothetical protein
MLVFAAVLLIVSGMLAWFEFSVRISPPEIPSGVNAPLVSESPDGLRRCGSSWLKQDSSGLWIMYLKGDAYSRGLAHGLLAKDLVREQEKAFVGQIRKLVPREFYLKFLKQFVYWFNRNLDDYVKPEFLQEIYGVSRSASPEFDFIGSPYERMLNYHSAHDIGHAMEQLNLVGCTSFGVWGASSSDSGLLTGRNFDFYMGDEFARNKIVCFEDPDKGIPFMMVTWAGMTGAVSGLNAKGLSVTINAAKSEIPWSARTPISLLAREILQYASDIREALTIAEQTETFVSESLLIGSSADGIAVIIEKSPFRTAVYRRNSYLVCANRFQSAEFSSDILNVENTRDNASVYREIRLKGLIDSISPVDPDKAAFILRDRGGIGGKNIGLGNEKAMNQLIAHHAVIFQNNKLLAWVSAGPWQCGSFICFDLNIFFNKFATVKSPGDLRAGGSDMSRDPFLKSPELAKVTEYRRLRDVLSDCLKNNSEPPGGTGFLDEFARLNPEYFETWFLCGEYYRVKKDFRKSLECYERCIRCEIPRWFEKKKVIAGIAECRQKLNRN